MVKGLSMKAFWIALSSLTLFPLSPTQWTARDLKESVAYYPLIGALIGTVLALASIIQLPHDLKALVLTLLWVVMTAAFHLDGLSDCLDGFFGGKNPQERRRIMKDPAVGAYGATGIALALLFKYGLLTKVLASQEDWKWLLLIPLSARWAVTFACTLFKAPKGDKGLGSQVVGLPPAWFAASTVLSLG